MRGVRQGYLPATVTGVDRRQAVAHEGPIARCCNHFFYRDRDHRTPRTKPSGERFHDGTFWFTMSDGPSSVVRRQLPRTTDHGQNTLGDWGGRKSGTRETELGNEGGLFCRCRPVQQSAVSSQHLSSVPPVPVCRSPWSPVVFNNGRIKKPLLQPESQQGFEEFKKWSEPGSNRRHMDFQSIALPTELSDPRAGILKSGNPKGSSTP